jgi:transcriptional regulator with XRE-family HTH domain
MSGLSGRIRKARTLAKLSQAELARRVGVKRSAVTQWEHPAGTTPSVDHLIQIALQTQSRFEWLATGRGARQLEEAEATSAVIVDDYARDEHESQALGQLRQLPPGKRRLALDILRLLAH